VRRLFAMFAVLAVVAGGALVARWAADHTRGVTDAAYIHTVSLAHLSYAFPYDDVADQSSGADPRQHRPAEPTDAEHRMVS
jgi:hypothetical protein